jgi:hypothetical protein
LNDLLASVEASAFAAALRTSFYAYPLVNAAHILGAGGLVVLVWLMHESFWRGDPGRGRFLRRLAIGALVAMALSGAAMFSIKATEYADNPALRIKAALIAAAFANVIAYYAFGRRAQSATAVISVVLWPLVIVAGRFIGFV